MKQCCEIQLGRAVTFTSDAGVEFTASIGEGRFILDARVGGELVASTCLTASQWQAFTDGIRRVMDSQCPPSGGWWDLSGEQSVKVEAVE